MACLTLPLLLTASNALVFNPQLTEARQQRPRWTEEWHGAVPVPCRWARSIAYDAECGQNEDVAGFALTEAEREREGHLSPYIGLG